MKGVKTLVLRPRNHVIKGRVAIGRRLSLSLFLIYLFFKSSKVPVKEITLTLLKKMPGNISHKPLIAPKVRHGRGRVISNNNVGYL